MFTFMRILKQNQQIRLGVSCHGFAISWTESMKPGLSTDSNTDPYPVCLAEDVQQPGFKNNLAQAGPTGDKLPSSNLTIGWTMCMCVCVCLLSVWTPWGSRMESLQALVHFYNCTVHPGQPSWSLIKVLLYVGHGWQFNLFTLTSSGLWLAYISHMRTHIADLRLIRNLYRSHQSKQIVIQGSCQ